MKCIWQWESGKRQISVRRNLIPCFSAWHLESVSAAGNVHENCVGIFNCARERDHVESQDAWELEDDLEVVDVMNVEIKIPWRKLHAQFGNMPDECVSVAPGSEATLADIGGCTT